MRIASMKISITERLGNAARERRSKWRLLLPCLALAGRSLAVAQEPSIDASRIPRHMTECEGTDQMTCGTWTFTGIEGTGRWSNGAAANLTIQQFDPKWVIIRRTDTSGTSAGLTAIYVGQQHGQRVEGTVKWTWLGHWSQEAQGTWSATFDEPGSTASASRPQESAPQAGHEARPPVLGGNEERDRRQAALSFQQVPQTRNQATIAVVLDQEWTDTGVYFRQGQSVKVTAYGTMNWYTGDCDGKCLSTPAGIPCPGGGPMRLGLPCLSLLGRIGKNGRPFEVGESVAFTSDTPGEFFLGVNDNNLSDNTGAWTAMISSTSSFAEIKARQQTTLSVALGHPWTDTGVYLAQGQSVTVTAQGTMNWYTGYCDGKCLSTPAGIPCPGGGPKRLGLTCLSLIGLIGVSGRPFYVGDSLTFTAPAAGELFLGVNDDNMADNTGDWTATISSPIAFVQWAQAGRVRQQLQQQAQAQRSQPGISPIEGLILVGIGMLLSGDSYSESSDSCDAQCQELSRIDRYNAARARCNNADSSACSAINEPPPDPEPPR